MENEQADAGRDGRTLLARPSLRREREQGNIIFLIFPCSADPGQDWQPYPVDLHSAMCDDHTHIYIHVHFIPIVGIGKRCEYLLVHGDLPRQHSFGTTLRFTGPVLADSRQ